LRFDEPRLQPATVNPQSTTNPSTVYFVVIAAVDAASPSPAAVTVTVPGDPFTDRTIKSAMP
jgi:hypothetical protein